MSEAEAKEATLWQLGHPESTVESILSEGKLSATATDNFCGCLLIETEGCILQQ